MEKTLQKIITESLKDLVNNKNDDADIVRKFLKMATSVWGNKKGLYGFENIIQIYLAYRIFREFNNNKEGRKLFVSQSLKHVVEENYKEDDSSVFKTSKGDKARFIQPDLTSIKDGKIQEICEIKISPNLIVSNIIEKKNNDYTGDLPRLIKIKEKYINEIDCYLLLIVHFTEGITDECKKTFKQLEDINSYLKNKKSEVTKKMLNYIENGKINITYGGTLKLEDKKNNQPEIQFLLLKIEK